MNWFEEIVALKLDDLSSLNTYQYVRCSLLFFWYI